MREAYDEVYINCFRYLGYLRLAEIKELTLNEYMLRMQAYRLKVVDHNRDLHLQAWLNVMAKSTDKKSKPIYKNFNEFFDYEKQIKLAYRKPQKLTKTEKNKHLFSVASNLKKYREEENNE